MSYSANDVAKKIIAKTCPEEYGDGITNMKLQKMLYYMQGFHLAVFGTPLFDSEIEAWMYGPVVPSVYEEYKDQGSSILLLDKDDSLIEFNKEEEELFNQVYDAYGQFSALKLMNMTHSEIPWKSVDTGYGNVIEHDTMKEYFITQIES